MKDEVLQTRNLLTKFMGSAGIQFFGRGLTVLIGIILARVLGPEEFGSYALVMSIVALATIPTVAGLPQLIIREVAKLQLTSQWNELKGLFSWSSIYVVTLSIVMMSVVSLSIYFGFIKPSIGEYLWFGLLIIPVKGFIAKQMAILNGLRYPVLAQVPQGVVQSFVFIAIIACFSLMEYRFDAKVILLIQFFSSISALLISVLFVLQYSPKDIKNSSKTYKLKYWHSALIPFTLLSIISTLNNEIASVMLGFLDTEENVGYFKVAAQGVAILSLGLASINSVTGPNIVRLYKQGNHQEVQALLTKSVRFGALISLPFAIFLIFFDEYVVSLLFGQEYMPAAKLLSILCLGQIINVLMGSVGLVLQMTGYEKRALRTLLITIIITIALLCILIPLYQDVGAAIAASVSLIVWNVIMAWEVYRTSGLVCWIR
ncbi:flippase [Vibrio toranzoniae]|uniref:flippase n=1 Tax=Vibrio toranzoniae TaxID=1194427 RepID=UPI001378B89B|nr:flippase [Vibrio toranzoniae]NAZ70744.1 oligosaccharide flippase family protein [Vibrio toranzoniae]